MRTSFSIRMGFLDIKLPRVQRHELTGTVEICKDIENWKPGERVAMSFMAFMAGHGHLKPPKCSRQVQQGLMLTDHKHTKIYHDGQEFFCQDPKAIDWLALTKACGARYSKYAYHQ